MLHKEYIDTTDLCAVTFALPEDELPPNIVVNTVTIAGEFNDWNIDSTPLLFDKAANEYRVTLELAPATSYQYRFVINDDQWYNDWEADAYATTNVCEGENCIVHTLDAPEAE